MAKKKKKAAKKRKAAPRKRKAAPKKKKAAKKKKKAAPKKKKKAAPKKKKKAAKKKRKKQLRKEEDSFFFNRKLNLSFLFLKNRDFISNYGVLRPRFLLLSKSNKEIMDQKNASR